MNARDLDVDQAMQRPRLRGGRAGLGLLLLAGWLAPLAPAAEPAAIENVRVGLQNTYKLGAWTPVWIDLQGAFSGTLEIETPDEDGTPAYVRLPLTATTDDGPRTVAAYLRPGAANAEITARLLTERGRRASRDAHPEDRGSPAPNVLNPDQSMIVTLGNPQGLTELPTVAGVRAEAESLGRPNELVIVQPRVPQDLPGRWLGYDAASVVVLDINDSHALEALRARGEGLKEWVRRGGHLVVAGAGNGQAAADVLGELLPARPAGTTRLNDSGEIEAFARSTIHQLLPLGQAITVAKLEVIEGRPTELLAATTSTPLVVRGAYGFGRVTQIGIDVDQNPFSSWKDRPLFWVRALDLRVRGGLDAEGTTATGSGTYFQNASSDLAGVLFRTMDRPPGVTLVPFGWVAFFIFLYILLIGPGDYFFLKKVVRRMEFTWLTFPLIVMVVSAVAYVAAYSLKGRELKVIKVDAVDVDQPAGLVRGSSWMTVFSPQNRDYDVTVQPTGPTAPAPRETSRLVSVFGPPEPQIGGGGALGLTAGGYTYTPAGEAEALAGVRIPIWSTKSFTARWFGPAAAAMVESDLVPAGSDRLEGTVVNRCDATLRNAVLIFNNQVYDQVGDLPPGASARVGPTSRVRPLSGYLEDCARRAGGDTPAAPTAAPSFADLMRTLMFRQGMNPKTTTPPSLPLRGLDLTGQLALGRPMLVAELDAPAAELNLEGAPKNDARIEQTTVVRIILWNPPVPQ